MEKVKEENIIYDEYQDLLDLAFDGETRVADVDQTRNIRSLEKVFTNPWRLIAKSATEKIGREVTPWHCESVVVCYLDDCEY